MATLTESELREAVESLEKFKSLGLDSTRFDPTLKSGVKISFVKNEDEREWTLK